MFKISVTLIWIEKSNERPFQLITDGDDYHEICEFKDWSCYNVPTLNG